MRVWMSPGKLMGKARQSTYRSFNAIKVSKQISKCFSGEKENARSQECFS